MSGQLGSDEYVHAGLVREVIRAALVPEVGYRPAKSVVLQEPHNGAGDATDGFRLLFVDKRYFRIVSIEQQPRTSSMNWRGENRQTTSPIYSIGRHRRTRPRPAGWPILCERKGWVLDDRTTEAFPNPRRCPLRRSTFGEPRRATGSPGFVRLLRSIIVPPPRLQSKMDESPSRAPRSAWVDDTRAQPSGPTIPRSSSGIRRNQPRRHPHHHRNRGIGKPPDRQAAPPVQRGRCYIQEKKQNPED